MVQSKAGAANIRERLDKVVISLDWRILFPKDGVVHLNDANSDHVHILLHSSLDHPKTPTPFKFF